MQPLKLLLLGAGGRRAHAQEKQQHAAAAHIQGSLGSAQVCEVDALQAEPPLLLRRFMQVYGLICNDDACMLYSWSVARQKVQCMPSLHTSKQSAQHLPGHTEQSVRRCTPSIHRRYKNTQPLMSWQCTVTPLPASYLPKCRGHPVTAISRQRHTATLVLHAAQLRTPHAKPRALSP
jgi:hypothetical protein